MIKVSLITQKNYLLGSWYFPLSKVGLEKAREKRNELLAKYLDHRVDVTRTDIDE